MEKILCFLNGYVKILIHGGQTERFFNLCMARGIVVRDLKQNKDNSFSCILSVSHFFLLGSIRRKTKVRIHILEKHGLPFWMEKSAKRKAFFLGMFSFGLLLLILSGRIWNIHIEGNRANSTPEILKFLEVQGVSHGMKKGSVNCNAIASAIREEYPQTAWVSARTEGTQLIITVKEGDFRNKKQKEKTESCNLTATEAGTVVRIITRAGVPQIRPGEICKKGDILVSGCLELKNDSQEVTRYEYVHADADIYIKRKLPYYAELPLEYETEIRENIQETGGFLKIGRLYLEWGEKHKNGWHTLKEEFPVKLTENFKLPVSTGRITMNRYRKKKLMRTEKEAKAEAFSILQDYEEKLMEKGVQISANNVKIDVDHRTCISRGNLEIIEKIGKETPVEILEQPKERTTENG
ncbi:sporulation protein YqfD [Blautia sp. XA-2221]|uniref:sporulation protein YqfD n=1 Tax=Blautia sp. XA-2221 TaxID=2903961 RepID=UPI002378404B|nr:sporulation protein YqfD [Blautia sp. XA-2221]